MPSTITDRLQGLSTSVAVKPPCIAVALTNITLSGLQTVNSVVLAEGDRVLVAAKTDAKLNGIYNASTGIWPRAKDFDGNRDVVDGTLVVLKIANGSGALYQVVCADNPVIIGTSAITFVLRDDPAVTYPQIQAEINASVTPTITSREVEPIIDARRYGFSAAQSASANVASIRNAMLVATALGGGTVQLPSGAFNVGGASDVIDLPQYVRIRGTGPRGSMLTSGSDGNTGGLFRLGGAKSGVVKYGCGLSDLGIVLTHADGKAIQLMETVGAYVGRLYLEGLVTAVRNSEAIIVDGGDVSAFFNTIEKVVANHFHIGYHLLTTGTTKPTQQKFDECSIFGDVATDTTSKGFIVESGCGGGNVWVAGNFESCQRGAQFKSGCQSGSMYGARFEGNTNEIEFQATAGAQSVFGCNLDETKILDNSNVNYHKVLGCTNGSNVPCVDQDPGQMLKRAIAASQTPLIIEGFPGDTTTEEFIIRNSSGQKLFSVTNQGKFLRINNAAPATVTGSRGANAALASLLTTLASYGLIVDGSS